MDGHFGRLPFFGDLPIRDPVNLPIVLSQAIRRILIWALPERKDAIMDSQQNCRVFGLLDNGEQIAITTYTTRANAERILRLIEPHSAFAKLTVECDEDDTG
jgi:hypothetical protein